MTSNTDNNKGITLNFSILIYSLFSLLVILENYIIYFLKKSVIESYFFAFAILLVVIVLLHRMVKIEFNRITITDVFVILICFFTFILKVAFPDSGYDTCNYHIYFQELLGKDFVHYDFFPMRSYNAHSFILGDQMFYPFRLLFGFRFGTILNTLVIILTYFQVKKIIKSVLRKMNRKNYDVFVSIASILIILTHSVWNLYNVYYVDVLPIPFLLEIVYIIVNESEQNILSTLFVVFLAGASVAIKISNGIPLFILAIIYLIKFRKNIKTHYIISAFAMGVFCIGIYAMIGIQLTGNPIFPHGNIIFHSPYFTDMSVNDYNGLTNRYGPQNLVQWIGWPVYVIFYPLRCGGWNIYTGRLLLIFIYLIFFICCITKNTKEYHVFFFVGFFLVLYLLYMTVCSGDFRYMPLLEIEGGIMCYFIFDSIVHNCKKTFKWIPVIILGIVTILQCSWHIKTHYFDTPDWTARETIFSAWEDYKLNAKFLFKDRSSEYNSSLDISSIKNWVIAYSVSYPEVLLNKDARMISLQEGVTNEETQKLYDDIIKDIENEDVYTAVASYALADTSEILCASGWKIDEVYSLETTFAEVKNPIIVLKVKNIHKQQKIQLLNMWQDTYFEDLSKYHHDIEIKLGITYSPEEIDSVDVYVSLIDQNGNEEKCLYDGPIVKKDAYIKININKNDLEGKTLYIENKDQSCFKQQVRICGFVSYR